MNNGYSKASEIVTKVFENIENSEIDKANKIITFWKNLVGDKIASHSKILDVDKQILMIEVDHNGWAQQILCLKSKIIEKMEKKFPELNIVNIAVRVKTEYTQEYKKQTSQVGIGVPRFQEHKKTKKEQHDKEDLKTALENLVHTVEKYKYYD